MADHEPSFSPSDCRIGVYVCHCGTNIGGVVDVPAVVQSISKIPSVLIARDYAYMCSDPGQALIQSDIRDYDLNRVVVASCSPLMHEDTFRNACKQAGLNPYYFQMVNIREHVSWVHGANKEAATEKARDLVAGAVWRVREHRPLYDRNVDVRQSALVVGAGIAGIEAALRLADSGKHVYLVEKEAGIGGHMTQLYKTFPTLDCAA